jgi:alkanesulfonate monooxygenase SsuD/methylene tetrahydromethanopterin reductase-like flavin-dependent oxidoreductase (luciferase family)
MPNVQFGVVVPTESLALARLPEYTADVDRLLSTVKGHFDSAWMVDHLQFDDRVMLEGWTTLTYLAARHPELTWGHTVLCQSFRNPALVAKMGATLQLLSGGRLILGMGAGWHEAEYHAYGYDFATAGVRVEALDEALTIIKSLWTQARTTFTGQHHQVHAAQCVPRPDPLPIIMVGAFKPKMLRVVARHADWWNVSSTSVTDYRQYVTAFERACEEVNRDPATVRRTWCGGCACGRTAKEVAVLAGERLQLGEDLVGTPQQIIEQIQALVDLGIDYFMLDCIGFPELTTATLLVDEVFPAFRT